MMSPTALSLREIRPVRSFWCEIQDFQRVFYATAGMATLVPEQGAVTHAVAHEITKLELEILEGREPPSVPVRVRLRGTGEGDVFVSGLASVASNFRFLRGFRAMQSGQRLEQAGTGAQGSITAVTEEGVYISALSLAHFDCTGMVFIDGQPGSVPLSVTVVPPIECQPTERYLDLMLEGAKAVGMDAAIVQEIASTSCTPRKSAEEFQRLPIDETVADRYFTFTDIEQNDSLYVLRGRVYAKPMVIEQQPGSQQRVFGSRSSDVAGFLSHQMYDPLFGRPPTDPRQPWPGWGFIEDMIVTFFLPRIKHVGWIVPAETSKL